MNVCEPRLPMYMQPVTVAATVLKMALVVAAAIRSCRRWIQNPLVTHRRSHHHRHHRSIGFKCDCGRKRGRWGSMQRSACANNKMIWEATSRLKYSLI